MDSYALQAEQEIWDEIVKNDTARTFTAHVDTPEGYRSFRVSETSFSKAYRKASDLLEQGEVLRGITEPGQ